MLIPIVSTSTLPATLDDTTHKTLARLGVAGDIMVEHSAGSWDAETVAKVKQVLKVCQCRVGPFTAAEVDIATGILDAGAQCVVFDVDGSPAASASATSAGSADAASDSSPISVGAVAEAISTLPASRVSIRIVGATVAAAPADAASSSTSAGDASAVPSDLIAAVQALRQHITGLVVLIQPGHLATDSIKQLRQAGGLHVSLMLAPQHSASAAAGGDLRSEEVGRLHRHDVHVVSKAQVAATREDVELGEAEGVLDVGTCLSLCVRSDRPDGLFTTVVSDEVGVTLGLVYSSKESVVEAVKSGRGVYYSRSRNGLWRKGDTSGSYQVLESIRLDCDADALLFRVRQMGAIPAFCHLNTRTCWGDEGGITALERTLAARKIDAPPGSYTKRLFDDHELLRNKLLEEAQELAEAEEPDHVAAEAADLLYFAFVSDPSLRALVHPLVTHLHASFPFQHCRCAARRPVYRCRTSSATWTGALSRCGGARGTPSRHASQRRRRSSRPLKQPRKPRKPRRKALRNRVV
jgi:phosphoribosyl-ATP pyrophosphohydrolase